MRQRQANHLRLVTAFVGQDCPVNGGDLALRVLRTQDLSPDARLVLRGLIEAHGDDHWRKAEPDAFMDVALEAVGMFARVTKLENVRQALRELDRAQLLQVQFRDAIRTEEESLRIRFDYEAIAALVGMHPQQHNAPRGLVSTRPLEGEALASSDIERHPIGRE